MAPYVNETGDGTLRIILAGEETRIPLDRRGETATVTNDHPEWAARLAREHGYDVDDQTAAVPDPASEPTAASSD